MTITRSGDEPGRVEMWTRLEEAEVVQPTLGRFNHSVIVGVAFADIELAPDDVIARARVADDVDALDVDLRRVIDGERQSDLMRRVVALAMRPNVGERHSPAGRDRA